jgi:threonine/homoserine/homoserine lactone efflux protein
MLFRLIVLAAAAYGVWRFWQQIMAPAGDKRPEAAPRRSSAPAIEDLTQCRICQSFVAASAGGCGRQDCPRRN